MAGLLDIFGTSGADTMGLLGMSPEDIGRSRDEAQAQALYALAGRLFKGGNGASSVLEGLQQGQQAYKQAMQGGLQEQLQKAQLQEMLKKKQLEEKQRRDELIADEIYRRGYKPAVAGKESMPIEEDGRFIGDSQAVAAQPSRFDIASIAPELIMAGPAGQARLKTALELNKSMAGETFKLGEGEKQYQRDPLTGEVKEVATGAPKREATQADIAKYEYAKKNDGYKGTFTQFLIDEARAKATNITLPSEGERKAATLASRLNFSVGQMNQAIGADPKAAMPNTAAEIARFVSRTDFLPNKLNSEQRQIVEAAQEDVLDAALTLGTGAAYSREQLAGYKKSYFPQIGDSPAAVKTKQERLNNLLKSAEVASGRAANQITAPIPKIPQPTDFEIPAGVTVKKKG